MQKSKMWIRAGVGAAILLSSVGGARLWAQSQNDPIPQSADEAAKAFVLTLSANPFLNPFRSKSEDLFEYGRLKTINPEMSERLMARLFTVAQFNAVEARTLYSNNRQRANVTVMPVSKPKPLPPVACVQSAGGWKVDLLETARNWIGSQDPLMQEIDAALQTAPANAATTTSPATKVPSNASMSEAPPPADIGITPTVSMATTDARASEVCSNRLRQVGLAMRQYMQDYDDKLPPADKWQDDFTPYVKNNIVFHCPVLEPDGHGYAMNWKLSKHIESDVENPAKTVVIYENNVPRPNANYDGRDLIFRHELPDGIGANFLYVDGHVSRGLTSQNFNFRLNYAPYATNR